MAVQKTIKQGLFNLEQKLVAGVDEAGRGPLAGPLAVAAVILGDAQIPGLDDSKKLSKVKREKLFWQITSQALAWSVVFISPAQIDELNILQATMYGMKLAIERLKVKPKLCLIDGNRLPQGLEYPAKAEVKGDARFACIAAASILAKTARDRVMTSLHNRWPDYGFNKHMGYPTAIHLQQLAKLGPCPIHRRSYGPVAQAEFIF